jgi:hypothetical protein
MRFILLTKLARSAAANIEIFDAEMSAASRGDRGRDGHALRRVRCHLGAAVLGANGRQ